jgi:hypothetical protein
MTNAIKFSICTTVCNRLFQFQHKFAGNRDVILANRDVEWIILDYDSTDGLHAFVTKNTPKNQSRIVFIQRKQTNGWHAPIAKNIAHKTGRGTFLMNLDCDNSIDDAIVVMNSQFRDDVDALHLWSGVYRDGTFGRIALRQKLFFDIGGYDESFQPMGYEDRDLLNRILSWGGNVRWIPCGRSLALRNSRELSVRCCKAPILKWREMERMNRSRSKTNIKKGFLIANSGGQNLSTAPVLGFSESNLGTKL